MNIYKIPLDGVNQIFDIDLAGTAYKMRLYFNSAMDCWIFDLMDNDGNNITQHQPLISGVNILDQYAYLNIKGIFVVYTEGDANAIPNEDDLGDISNLYFITNN